MRGTVVTAIAAVCLIGQAPSALAQGGYSGAVTVVRSHGNGVDRSDTVYFLNSIDVTRGRIRATVMLPLLTQQTVWAVAPGVPEPAKAWNGTMGDPTLRADVAVAGRHAGPWSVTVNAALKVPVADVATGLGSGEIDKAFGVTLTGTRRRSSYLLDVSYWVLGDPPDISYRDGPAFFLGYATVLGDSYRWSAMIGLAGSRSVVEGLDPPMQISAGVLRSLQSRVALGAALGIGMTDTAADWTASFSWRIGF